MTGRYEVMAPDAEGQRLVDSSKVPERENHDQTHPINADRTLIRFQLLTGRCSASDRTLGVQRPVDISKVPVRGKHDQTRSVSAGRTLASVQSTLNHWSSGYTDRSIWST